MLFQGLNLRHILILTGVYGRAVLRSGAGLLFLNLFLFSGLIIASVMIDTVKPIQEQMQRRDEAEAKVKNRPPQARQPSNEDVYRFFHRAIIAWFLDVDVMEAVGGNGPNRGGGEAVGKNKPILDYLMNEQSPVLSSYFILLLVSIPFTTCLAAFNLFSGDIGSKGLRYLLLRTERINVFLSRFLGTLLFINIISIAMIFVVVFFHMLKLPPKDTSEAMALCAWGARGWLAVFILGLPYLCLCSWLSTMVDTPIVSMVLCYLTVGFPILVIKLVGVSMPKDFKIEWLDRLTPWGWRHELLYPILWSPEGKDAGTYGIWFFTGIAVHLAFAAVFFLLGVWHFSKRDL